MPALQLILLCENTARGAGILGEHGLAWWIETRDGILLFDTGQGLSLRHNAERLGLSLSRVAVTLLSHGHYDHVGGLEGFLAANASCPIWAHPAAMAPKFLRTPEGTARRISTSFFEGIRSSPGFSRFRTSSAPTELLPQIFSTGQIPRITDFEDTGGPFFLDESLTVPDPLLDDLSLFFETDAGVIVVLGCAHAGLVNILLRVKTLAPGRPMVAIFGGMHLEAASSERMTRTVAALRELGSPQLFPNHCTGQRAIFQLREAFPDRVHQAAAGMRWTF